MKKINARTSLINMNGVYDKEDRHMDENSIECSLCSENHPMIEHMSNARIMPLTGPYGRLDLMDTYEYGSVPRDPATPMESYEVIMDKNTQKKL